MVMDLSPDRILQLGFGFWGPKALLSAVELDLFTHLAKGPLDADALGQKLGLHQRSIRDFLDALVALGMLDRKKEQYSNTSESELFLDRNKPSYVGGILEMCNNRLYPHWSGLTRALQTGLPQNEVKGEDDFFAALYSDPGRMKGFLQSMTGLSMGTSRAIAVKFPWNNYHTLMDIGTAQGALPVQVALAHPHISGGGFDLPVVAPVFDEYVASFNLADRLRFHPGDFMKEELPRADVMVMGHILHDWNLDEKRMLIAKAYAALPPNGTLIVFETLIDDDRRSHAFGLLMSLNMLVETPGGFDFTGADCCRWLKEAGFAESRVEHLMGPDWMVVGVK